MPRVEFTRVPTLPFIVAAMEEDIGARALRRCFDAVGVHRELACAPASILPMRDLFGLFEAFARARGEHDFGIFVGRSLKPEAFGLFVHYAMQGANLGAMMRRAGRSLHLHQTCSVMAPDLRGDVASWSYRVTLPLTLGRHHHAVHVLVQMFDAMVKYLGRPVPLAEVGLEAARPQRAAEIEQRFQAPVLWRQPTNHLRFAASLLQATPARPLMLNPTTWQDLIRYARTTPPRTATEKAEAALRICLADGTVSTDAVAGYLNVGSRTLQRRLAAEGVAFSDLLEHVRRRRAEELLTDSGTPLWRIAELLCYSDPAHFSRAYRRWNGQPPNERRRQGDRLA